MTKRKRRHEEKDFLPIILGSDENAYGTARLFREAYPEVTPLLVCTAQLIPTRHSRLFDCRIIAGFEREEVFPDALLGVLRECSKDYEKAARHPLLGLLYRPALPPL